MASFVLIAIFILAIFILSIMYIVRLIKRRFEYENRKEIIFLQKVIYSLAIIGLLSGMIILFIPIIILMIGLAISPEKSSDFIKSHVNKHFN